MYQGKRAIIAGIGETPVGSLPGMTSVEIQALAVRQALADCGLSIRDVDGLISLDPYITGYTMFGATLAEHLGLRLSHEGTIDVGGTVTFLTMIQQAVRAVEADQCNVVVCVFGENTLSARPQRGHGLINQNLRGTEQWEDPFRADSMVVAYGLVAQRYFHETGASSRDLAAVAMTTREHAVQNDNAVMRKPLTLEEYEASRMVASPLRMLDCCLISDGGGAVIVMKRNQADRLGLRSVGLRSMAMRTTHRSVAQMPSIDEFCMKEAGRVAFEQAGVDPRDIDLALVHDAFTISVLITLEDVGLCARGEAGKMYREGMARLGGRCPINTHGGLLSQAHIGGMLHLTEAVRQLRHDAGARQVEGARVALVAGLGGVFSVCGAAILERLN